MTKAPALLPSVLCGATALLAGCASVSPPPVVERAEPAPAVAQPAAKPAPTAPRPSATAPSRAPRGGGYYKDDGPGEGPLPDMAAIEDAEPRVEPLHRFANNPYNVFGVDYTPMRRIEPFRQRGLGSWYGKKFHGQKTSSGEVYDMYGMTAAHPTLPIPSYARVTRRTGGTERSVIVRVNDRGPFHPGRVIDLSYTAAWKLGYIEAGSAPVEVELIQPGDIPAILAARRRSGNAVASATPPATAPAPAPTPQAAPREEPPVAVAARSVTPAAATGSAPPASGGVYLQLGAFSARDNAESFRARVYRELQWLNDAIEIHPRDGLFRLHLGPYRDRTVAGEMAEKLRETLDLKPVFIQR